MCPSFRIQFVLCISQYQTVLINIDMDFAMASLFVNLSSKVLAVSMWLWLSSRLSTLSEDAILIHVIKHVSIATVYMDI